MIGSTNGGLVAYISLGQLPNNPWGRKHNDIEGFNYVSNFGEAYPYTYEADAILKRKALEDIANEPRAFINKVLHNFRSALTGGVYAGDNQVLLSRITKYILVILLIVQIHFTIFSLKYKIPKDIRLALYYSWVILIFSFSWVSILQYQPRHLNGVYAILLVTAIIFASWIQSGPEKVKKKSINQQNIH